MEKSSLEILKLICQVIYDKKGINTLTLDIRGLSNIAEYVVIAEGNVDRHVSALGHSIISELRDHKIRKVHAEGLESGEWVVLDFAGIMVHIFTPNLRQKYSLEQLWPDSKIVDIEIDLSEPVIAQRGGLVSQYAQYAHQ